MLQLFLVTWFDIPHLQLPKKHLVFVAKVMAQMAKWAGQGRTAQT